MASGSRSARDGAARGQTGIDFLIGVAVFLLAVTFVFATIPGMIDPFSEAQEETLVADRVASQLAESTLGVRDAPSELNETCTFAFFTDDSGTDCPVGFEASDDLTTKVGIDDQYRLNVSLRRSLSDGSRSEILCTNGTAIAGCGEFSDPDRLAIGQTSPTSLDSVTSARRTVYLDGKDMTLVVRLW